MHRLLLCLLAAGLLTAADESEYQKYDGRAMLGIEMTPPSAQTQSREGLDPSQGVEIQHVYPGTAAEKMGLKPGDVILAVNGGEINSMTDLRNEVALSGVGGAIDVVVSRGGQRTDAPGTLGEWPKHIPYTPIDDAAERRFRDWQKRRLDRTEQAMDNLRSQVAGLEKRQQQPSSGRPQAMALASPAAALALPVGTALASLPAWRLRLELREMTPLPKAKAPPITPADRPDAWNVRVLTGSPAPEVL